MKAKGVVAAGHDETARAAKIILDEGGNAFDAVLAALCAACITEPVLASLGGGGFLLAHSMEKGGAPLLYDFFTHTPRHKRDLSEVDFFPVVADFGEAQQEFHIGMGSMATPGVVKGLFGAHRDLGSMPVSQIIEPALKLARDGVVINRFQDYLFTVVEQIYISNETCLKAFESQSRPGKLAGEGDILNQPDFADTLDCLAREGEDLFYKGEIAALLARDSEQLGGYLRREDLEAYQLHRRAPLELKYDDARILTNPPPSTGGILIAFALGLLAGGAMATETFASPGHLETLLKTMMLTNEARIESHLRETPGLSASDTLLDPDFLELYRTQLMGRPKAHRGTTQISVIDARGNAASLTLSNGEGAAYFVPGTGIMINNMLGEEDINPQGFNQWPQDVRMASMMSPSLMERKDGQITALGSGGSNRIRTAILQVIVNMIDFDMPLKEAIESPRIHFERGLLSVENGFGEGDLANLQSYVEEMKIWSDKNMFFGGVHAVHLNVAKGHLEGAGDPRRAGITLSA